MKNRQYQFYDLLLDLKNHPATAHKLRGKAASTVLNVWRKLSPSISGRYLKWWGEYRYNKTGGV